ncbi:MAG: hypothetical protein IPG87_08425 [Saprospiraceae bacterium]|nr:hypothetical protein [Candidatus Vicinibacter affinis]
MPTFPHSSVALKLTLFGPMLAQVKLDGTAVITIAGVAVQLSETLDNNCCGVTVALPFASRKIVIFLHKTTGAVLSKTVIT